MRCHHVHTETMIKTVRVGLLGTTICEHVSSDWFYLVCLTDQQQSASKYDQIWS